MEINGRWFRQDFHPAQNTLSIHEVVERIMREDLSPTDPNQEGPGHD